LYLEVLNREVGDGRRILLKSDGLVALQPFAAGVPFETWIMPSFPSAVFGDIGDTHLGELACVLRSVLRSLRSTLNDPDYNFVIMTTLPQDDASQFFIWHVRILPRLTIQAGLELGSGMQVNPTRPEETASMLRDALLTESNELL
jgi:UDPglucose--hexose-1-phosphate uridylyltransferase